MRKSLPFYGFVVYCQCRLSDAEWYCRKDPEEARFYEIFYQMCQKYGVRCASAEEKARRLIEEVTRVTYEREGALRLGFSLSDVCPSFAS